MQMTGVLFSNLLSEKNRYSAAISKAEDTSKYSIGRKFAAMTATEKARHGRAKGLII